MANELADRATAVGIPADVIQSVLKTYGNQVLQLLIDGTNRGLLQQVMLQVLKVDPQLLELLVVANTKKQAAGPLGSWSAAVHSGNTTDLLGPKAREYIRLAIAHCK